MAGTASQSTSSDTSTNNTLPCAWHMPQDQIQEGDSHGICDDCAEQILVTHYTNKYNSVPSYVERFKDGREAW
jgi:hypothetical protein